VQRAKQLLQELEGSTKVERQRVRGLMQRAEAADPQLQLSLFTQAAEHPALETLRELQIEELTPIEALTKLYELQRQARGAAQPPVPAGGPKPA
jgi:DNA mismatch repair protein MutS